LQGPGTGVENPKRILSSPAAAKPTADRKFAGSLLFSIFLASIVPHAGPGILNLYSGEQERYLAEVLEKTVYLNGISREDTGLGYSLCDDLIVRVVIEP
jgi:hypothetical protein